MSLLVSGMLGNSGKLSEGFLCWLLQPPFGPGPGLGRLPAAPVLRVPHTPVEQQQLLPSQAEGPWSRSSAGAGLSNRSSCCAAPAPTLLGPLTLPVPHKALLPCPSPGHGGAELPQGCGPAQQPDRRRSSRARGPQPGLPLPGAGALLPLRGLWEATAAAEGLGLPKVKLGEARIRGDSCWLPPLPLVPLLKLLARASVLSEAEVGSPLEGGEMGVSPAR